MLQIPLIIESSTATTIYIESSVLELNKNRFQIAAGDTLTLNIDIAVDPAEILEAKIVRSAAGK